MGAVQLPPCPSTHCPHCCTMPHPCPIMLCFTSLVSVCSLPRPKQKVRERRKQNGTGQYKCGGGRGRDVGETTKRGIEEKNRKNEKKTPCCFRSHRRRKQSAARKRTRVIAVFFCVVFHVLSQDAGCIRKGLFLKNCSSFVRATGGGGLKMTETADGYVGKE